MPELPEVETTRRGIAPHISGHTVSTVILRQPKLRWPVPAELPVLLKGRKVLSVERRAKYLLIRFSHGTLILHLGMSGSLRILPAATAAEKHDHVDIVFRNGQMLRFRDPRRFGCLLWTADDPQQHVLLRQLGPEPLGHGFNGKHLFRESRGRKQAVKTFIMDSRIVVGVGNIYASEALFEAGIRPQQPAGRISLERYERLALAIKHILRRSIRRGGTTLRDFVGSDGKPGYFQQTLNVYGRKGEPCRQCGRPVQHALIGQRSTYYCRHCQK